MRKLLVGMIFGVACASAQAQQSSILFTGQDLYTRLTSNTTIANGYIAGVADAHSGVTICIPPGIVTLERVPSERHLAADLYVQATLERRWPCAKRGQNL